MPRALAVDIGNGFEDGQGIYDAYIAHTPWLPSIYDGLKSLSTYIEKDAEFVDIMDIDQAARDASAYGGEMVAFPYDTNYIAMGWRQDVFELHSASYRETYNEELVVPKTIEELVLVSERLNGLDHNGDGEPDWGFCVSPQTKVFYAFLAPVMQTHLRECKTNTDGEFHCGVGERTGQNLFFDVDTFEPLIHNVSGGIRASIPPDLSYFLSTILTPKHCSCNIYSHRRDSSTPLTCTTDSSAHPTASPEEYATSRLLSAMAAVPAPLLCQKL